MILCVSNDIGCVATLTMIVYLCNANLDEYRTTFFGREDCDRQIRMDVDIKWLNDNRFMDTCCAIDSNCYCDPLFACDHYAFHFQLFFSSYSVATTQIQVYRCRNTVHHFQIPNFSQSEFELKLSKQRKPQQTIGNTPYDLATNINVSCCRR